MELLLHWDQVLGEMKDKFYGADERPARCRGLLTVCDNKMA